MYKIGILVAVIIAAIIAAIVMRDYMLPTKKPPTVELTPPKEFIPSKTFQGAKSGWYFGLGDRGLGYHVDNRGRI